MLWWILGVDLVRVKLVWLLFVGELGVCDLIGIGDLFGGLQLIGIIERVCLGGRLKGIRPDLPAIYIIGHKTVLLDQQLLGRDRSTKKESVSKYKVWLFPIFSNLHIVICGCNIKTVLVQDGFDFLEG